MAARARTAGALIAGIILGGASVGIAAIPDSGTGTITACMSRSGSIRIIDYQSGKRCRTTETLLSWGRQGPQGLTGTPGATGPQGPVGPTGPQGPAGGAPNAVLLDGNGVSLGQILPWSVAGTYYLWNGSKILKLYDNGLIDTPSPFDSFFVNNDCTGPALVNRPFYPNPDGTPRLIAIADPIEPSGFAYYEASTPGPEQSNVTTRSLKASNGVCHALTFAGLGRYELVLGARYQPPALPLTPTVVP